jgi:hypothetical protein
MARNELTSRASSSWLNEWWHPFLWITLTPAVTVPVSAFVFGTLIRQPEEVGFPPNNPQSQIDIFQGGSCDSFLSSPCHEYAEAVPALLAFAVPGLLNLAPIAWVLSKSIRVKVAALVALLLGALRSAIPVLVLMFGYETVANSEGTSYFRWDTLDFIVPSEPTFSIWVLGALAWFGSLLVWAVFRVLTRGPEKADIASVLLSIAGVLCLGLGLRVLTTLEYLYIGLPFVIVGAGALRLAFLGFKSGCPEEARHVP